MTSKYIRVQPTEYEQTKARSTSVGRRREAVAATQSVSFVESKVVEKESEHVIEAKVVTAVERALKAMDIKRGMIDTATDCNEALRRKLDELREQFERHADGCSCMHDALETRLKELQEGIDLQNGVNKADFQELVVRLEALESRLGVELELVGTETSAAIDKLYVDIAGIRSEVSACGEISRRAFERASNAELGAIVKSTSSKFEPQPPGILKAGTDAASGANISGSTSYPTFSEAKSRFETL